MFVSVCSERQSLLAVQLSAFMIDASRVGWLTRRENDMFPSYRSVKGGVNTSACLLAITYLPNISQLPRAAIREYVNSHTCKDSNRH